MSAARNAVEYAQQDAVNAFATGLSPVIVLNLFHSGLGIARQLRNTGVRVIGLSANSCVYGNFTRHCEVRVAPNSQEQPNELAEFLLDAAFELRGAVIFPTRDADVIFLDQFRTELEPLYKLAIPSRQVLFFIMDKAALARIAKQACLSIPRTVVVEDGSMLQTVAENVGFPCVVKPVRSIHWRRGDNWRLVGGKKAFRADDLRELELAYRRISPVHKQVLLQEWIPGNVDQIVVWGGYFSARSEPLVHFTARKIVQSPEDFGTGCLVESDEIPDLLEPSVRLCRALGYEGIAEIEYKRDPRDGLLKLIEMNPRHWDWHELGSASGINLSWAAYSDLTGRPFLPARGGTRRARWMAEDTLLTYLLATCLRLRTSGFGQILKTFVGHHLYGIFAWDDPLPFLRYFVTVLLPGLVRAVVRRITPRRRPVLPRKLV